MKTASWVIVHKPSNKVMGEIFSKLKADKINSESASFKAVPILEYLVSLNK